MHQIQIDSPSDVFAPVGKEFADPIKGLEWAFKFAAKTNENLIVSTDIDGVHRTFHRTRGEWWVTGEDDEW